jgi:ferredoxin
LTTICYFSGTGNTLWSAKKIADRIGGACELVNIGTAAQEDNIIEADAVVLLFPSYAYGLPLVVRSFVRNAVFKTPYIAAFVTFGSSPGGTLAALSRILKRKNTGAVYFGRIPAVENYIAIFGPPKETTMRRRLAMHRQATEEAVRCIIERRSNTVSTFHPFSVFIAWLFSKGVRTLSKYYHVSDDCNGCGICEKVCPVSCIVIQNDRPRFSDRCEHCNGCLNWCPVKAIHFGRLKSGSPRYHHPEINISDMSRHRTKCAL